MVEDQNIHEEIGEKLEKLDQAQKDLNQGVKDLNQVVKDLLIVQHKLELFLLTFSNKTSAHS